MALTSLQLWLLGLTFAAKVLAASTLVLTSPSSRYRDLVAVVILVLYYCFYRDAQLLKVEALRITLNTFSIIQVGNILDVLCITRLSYPERSPPETPTAKDRLNGRAETSSKGEQGAGFGHKLWWGLRTIWNFRGVCTPLEVKGTPRFSNLDPYFAPSRLSFLLRRCLSIAIRIAIINAWGGGWPLLSPLVDLAFPKQYLLSRLGDVSSHEMLIRVYATMLFWTKGYLNHSVAYDVLSVLAVASGSSQPRNWPPMYGSLKDCYTLRAWWGTTWHQLLRKQLISISNLVTVGIFRMRRGSLLARYSGVLLTFWISGVYHILSDGIEIDSGVVKFFVLQASGITIEDAVQALYRRSGSSLGSKGEKLLGYAWVSAFLVWTSPGWRYPVIVHRFRHEYVQSR